MERLLLILAVMAMVVTPYFTAASAAGGYIEDDYKFFGDVQELPAGGLVGDWKIGGKTIHVTQTTRIEQEHGQVSVGSYVKVEGSLQADGSINAAEIEVEQSASSGGGPGSKLYGAISSLPQGGLIGDWTIGGKTVHVFVTTVIEQKNVAAAIGVYVEVEGVLQPDGSLNAVKIETKLGSSDSGSSLEIKGKIETLPSNSGLIGDWMVAGRKIVVTAATVLEQSDGPFALGVFVEVKGTQQQDGSVIAYKIETEDDGGNSGEIEFKAIVEALPNTPGRLGEWMIGGRKVIVTNSTVIEQDDGPIAIGSFVEVKGGLQPDASILAIKIKTEDSDGVITSGSSYVKFYGTIEALPGTGLVGQWIVSGRKVNVSSTTRIEQEHGAPAVGKVVEVEGLPKDDGSIDAREIEIESDSSGGTGLFEFKGTIESLPGTPGFIGAWVVSGKTVNVDTTTFVKREYRPVVVGAFVEVKGKLQSDGSVNATVIEVKQGAGSGGFLTLVNQSASVSAANYQNVMTSDSIVAAFGSNLSGGFSSATTQPLPLSLMGTSVLIDGIPAGLFYVSPTQINYALPDGILPGVAVVTVLRNGAVASQGTIDLAEVAPSLFTADASGTGAPAGLVLRLKPNGEQIYESLVRFDATMNMLVPVTIQRNGQDRIFLILFGSGLRNAPNSDGDKSNGVAESVEVTIGGVQTAVLFAAGAPNFVSLDQINIELPPNAPSGQTVPLVMKVKNSLGGTATSNQVIIAIQ